MGCSRSVEGLVRTVALVFRPSVEGAERLAEKCARVVESGGYLPEMIPAPDLAGEAARSDLRLAVTFGGDGTIIRTARWLAGTGVPILGVAMGKLGFLTELPPEGIVSQLPSVLAGNYWADERLMLLATVNRDAGDPGAGPADRSAEPLIALNEAVITRGDSPKVIQLEVTVDGAHLVNYVADGLILATPTGSTAYALAAGGPVLAPGVQGMLMVPLAAHLAVLRSLVLPLSSRIEVKVTSKQPVLLVVDGRDQVNLASGQPVTVELAKERTVFARTSNPTRFYQILMQSLKKR